MGKGRRALVVVAVLLMLSLVGFAQDDGVNLSSGRSFGVGVTLSSPPMLTGIWCVSDQMCLELMAGYMSGVIMATGSLQYRMLDGAAFDVLPYLEAGYWGVSIVGYTFGGPIVGAGAIAEYSLSKSIVVRGNVGVTYIAADFGGISLYDAFGFSYGLSLHYYFGTQE